MMHYKALNSETWVAHTYTHGTYDLNTSTV